MSMGKTKNTILIGIASILAATLLIVLIFLRNKNRSDNEIFVPPPVPGEVVYIPYPVAITLDGDLSDWRGLPSINVVDEDARDPAENGSFSFSLAADKDNLYLIMQMPDQIIIAGEHRAEYWNEDSFEFYINASDNLDARRYAEKIFQININATDIGNTDPDALTITGVFSTGQVVTGYVFETSDGWGFEIGIPLEGLIEPEHGLEFGFQAQINGAFAYDRNVKITWSNADTSDLSWSNPSLFGRALFYKVGNTDIPQSSYVPPTAVPTVEAVIIPDLISVNQTGYFINVKKTAVLVSEETQPIKWQLLDSNGSIVLEGETTYFGKDQDSRDNVHWIDFSRANTAGIDFQITTAGLTSVPFDISNDIYAQLQSDALAYYYHNRSGIPIEAAYVGTEWERPAGHLSDNNVTCFKGQDADGINWPGCNYSLDVSGGWYDAGDFGKYVVNGGISAWTLMNIYEQFPDAYPDGSLNIPENKNGVSDILDEARWEMDFLLSMQVPAGQPNSGMAHHKIHDRIWGPIPMMPPTDVDNDLQHEDASDGRYLYPPSTTATLNLAATAAQCARIWLTIDPDFSAQCLDSAELAWQAARKYPDLYAGDTPGDGGGNYGGTIVADEFYWAAAELYITTGKDEYLAYLLNTTLFGRAEQFDWDRTASLGTISLALGNHNLSTDLSSEIQENIITFADEIIAIQNTKGYLVPIDGDYPWGSNGLILNNLILLSLAHDISGNDIYLDGVIQGMDYVLGRNALNNSFITGYGEYATAHPHHRFWANTADGEYPPPPPGAVSGGPNADPTDPDAIENNLLGVAPAKRYLDTIGSYSTNEITINWNAPLAWVVTYLIENTK